MQVPSAQGNLIALDEKIHKFVCDLHSSDSRMTMLLLPRDSYKTTVGTIAFSVWLLCKDIKTRILICNASSEKTRDMLHSIRKWLEETPEIQELWSPKLESASGKSLTLKGRGPGAKEPNVVAAGVGTHLTSGHYDYIIYDDIENDQTTATMNLRAKSKKWFAETVPLRTDGKARIVGTRWDIDDVYYTILDKKDTSGLGVDIFIKPAATVVGSLSDPKTVRFTNLLYPSKLNEKFLKTALIEMGPYAFSCQYLLDPLPQTEACFKDEWLHLFTQADFPHKLNDANDPLNIYITIDPAFKVNSTADYTGIVVSAVDTDGIIWVLDAYRKRMEADELIKLLQDLDNIYNPLIIGIEASTAQYALYKYLQHLAVENRDNSVLRKLHELETMQRNKGERIQRLIPYFANRMIKINETLVDFIHQLKSYVPTSRHPSDDLIDAFAYLLDDGMMNKPTVRQPALDEPKPGTYGYYMYHCRRPKENDPLRRIKNAAIQRTR